VNLCINYKKSPASLPGSSSAIVQATYSNSHCVKKAKGALGLNIGTRPGKSSNPFACSHITFRRLLQQA
jgi:hypothetical protein